MAAFCVRRLEALNQHDAEALARQHSEDGTLDSPLAGGSAQGRAAIEAVYETFHRACPDVRYQQEALLIDHDRVILLLGLTGTDSGGLMGQPPTGRSFSMSMVLLDEFQDGLIVREQRICELTGLLVQVGALKAKPA